MKKQKLKYTFILALIIIVLVTTNKPGYTQTYQFNQYYNTFQLLNPAFVGSSGLRYKLYTINRLQWIGIPDNTSIPFQTYTFSGQWTFGHPLSESKNYDLRQSVKNTYWSFGLSGIVHNQANGTLTSTSLLTSISVLQRIGEKAYIGAGIEANFNRNQLDDYIFVNDYLNGNLNANGTISESNSNITTGIILILKNYWVGVSLKDMASLPFANNDGILLNDNNSFYDNIYVHGGLSIPLKPEHDLYFTSSFSYKQRRQNKQWEYGAGLVFAFQSGYTWSGTIAYRDAGKSIDGLNTRDALIAAGGFNIPNYLIARIFSPEKNNPDKYKDRGSLGIGISADLIHTQFDGKSIRTWELSIILNAPSRKKSQNETRSYCEDFLHGPLAEQLTRNIYGGLAPYENRKKNPKDKNFSGEKENIQDIDNRKRDKKKSAKRRRKIKRPGRKFIRQGSL